jgi:hypothetical protein
VVARSPSAGLYKQASHELIAHQRVQAAEGFVQQMDLRLSRRNRANPARMNY